jgi:N-acetylmuramoyl-L-alanine amidase
LARVVIARATTPTPTKAAASASRTAKPAPRPPLIVIDPGHSGRYIRSTDARTGLRDIDYPNYPELYETFDISFCVARALRADGYRVKLTKKHAGDSVGLARRARIANKLKAALAISVHDDHNASATFEATYDQRGVKDAAGTYHPMFRGVGTARTVFEHPAVARRSQRAARIIADARSKAQHRKVSLRENSFTGRTPIEPGNLAMVQLLSDVPWVYNEMGAKTGSELTQAMSITSELRYARGLLAGVESAVPLGRRGAGASRSSAAKGLRSCLVRRVEPHPGTFTRPAAYLPYGYLPS